MAYSTTQAPPEDLVQFIPVTTFFEIPIVYKTKAVLHQIDGRNVIVQLWKGLCPSYLPDMIGGAGAEVGLYTNHNGVFMPDYQNKKKIWFRLWDRKNNRIFFTAGERTCWWRHKWMRPGSYSRYINDFPGDPAVSSDFSLHYVIKGNSTTIDSWWRG